MKIFAGYLLVVNLISLALMGLDKLRAVRRRRRIPEQVLLTLAALGGSIGTLAGMYLFRHKTRKKRFSVGIPIILVLQIAVLFFVYRSISRYRGSASAVVRQELAQIQDLDDAVISGFITDQTLQNGSASPTVSSTSASEAMSLFFSHFSYEILSEKTSGQTATVTVAVTNIDTHQLARDMCLAITKNRIQSSFKSSYDTAAAAAATDYYYLLKKTLRENEYELQTTQADFRLGYTNGEWHILVDSQLQDELVSGFSTWINDPYLLSAQEVLELYLEGFGSLDADGWLGYLDMSDIFSTYSPNYATELDHLYTSQISKYYDWSVLSCQVTGDTATARINIDSIDMPHVISYYRQALLDYASTTESITSDSVTLADTAASLLIDAINEHSQALSQQLTVTLENDGTAWQMVIDDAFIDAVMGSMDSALAILRDSDS